MAPTFETLFESEAAFVITRLRWLGIPARDRGDVAQDVFVEVLRALERLDPARPVRPWLTVVTLNKARDYFKRGRVRLELLVGHDPDAVQEDSMLDRYDAATLVRRLLRSLSYDDREVLTLVDLEERSVPEVAELLGLSVKAIESRLARARGRFRAAFERVQAGERRRLGQAVPLVLLVGAETLFGLARAAHGDLAGEVDQLRERMQRVLRPSLPRTQPPAPVAAWVGLAAITILATVGAVDGISHPRPVIGPECPPAAVVAVEQVPPAAVVTSAAAVTTAAPSASARPITAPPRPAARTTAPAASSSAVMPAELAEVELLGLARRALREGSPQRARVYLLRHARAYPSGSLAPEREVLLARVKGS